MNIYAPNLSGKAAATAAIILTVLLATTGCASTGHTEEEERLAALDEAQKRMEKIETEEQDFDTVPEPAGKRKRRENRDSNGVPILVTTMPMFSFTGRGMKIEFEDMLLTDLSLFADKDASSGYAALLSGSSSRAAFSITLPAGRYECLLSEKARAADAAHATVSVSIGEDSFDAYPSDPPLGIWELTTRIPIYFDVPEERPYLITISSAHAGMGLDYIQFVRMQ